MKTVKHLPDVLSVPVGTQVRCGKRSYTKATSGRWSVDLTQDLLQEVYQCYVVDRMTLREAKAALALPGLPNINVQKVLEEQGWMRSHYGRNATRDAWYAANRDAILKAHNDFGVDLRSIEEWSGVPIGTRLMDDGMKVRRSGRTATLEAALTSGWLSREQVFRVELLLGPGRKPDLVCFVPQSSCEGFIYGPTTDVCLEGPKRTRGSQAVPLLWVLRYGFLPGPWEIHELQAGARHPCGLHGASCKSKNRFWCSQLQEKTQEPFQCICAETDCK